jgi:DNA repair exonuclease SbcCD nuclease subunit
MSIKFLHTSDWQIGKLFGSIPEEPRALLGAQRYKTVEAIARLAADREVEAVLVAGDIFETNTVKDETIVRMLEALRPFPGPWVLLPGNHDPALAESVWTRLQRFGCRPSVVLALSPEPLLLADGRLAVLPAPLVRRHDARDLTEGWPDINTPGSAIRVGLAHGCVEERLPERGESLNSIPAGRPDSARLDYLALGDWHGMFQVGPRAWYSGTPEPDGFKQNDPGNVLLVSVATPGEPPLVERIPVGHYRWHKLSFSVLPHPDLAALEAPLSGLGEPWDRHVVSLQLTGTIDLQSRALLDEVLTHWGGRFRWLALDSEKLIPQPTEDDLDRIDKAGFVRAAVEKLRSIEADPSNHDGIHARDALVRLYSAFVGRERE